MTIPAYLAALLELAASQALPRDRVVHVDVRHDGHCLLLAGFGRCMCEPDVSLRPDASSPRRRN